MVSHSARATVTKVTDAVTAVVTVFPNKINAVTRLPWLPIKNKSSRDPAVNEVCFLTSVPPPHAKSSNYWFLVVTVVTAVTALISLGLLVTKTVTKPWPLVTVLPLRRQNVT